MTTYAWDDDYTPESDAMAAAEQQRQAWVEAALAKHPEARIFADMLHGPNQESIESLAADVAARFRKTQGGAGPRNTANSGSETPPALPGDHPSSAEVLASVRRGERDNDHQDARRDWIRAKLLEAAQDQ